MAVVIGVGTEQMAVANAISVSGKNPVQIVCPTCHQQIITQITEETGALTWILAVVLLLTCPCFSCVPFCVKECKDVAHFCPNCKTMLGIKKRI